MRGLRENKRMAALRTTCFSSGAPGFGWRLSTPGTKWSRDSGRGSEHGVLGRAELHKRGLQWEPAEAYLLPRKTCEEKLRSARSASLSGCRDELTSGKERLPGKGPRESTDVGKNGEKKRVTKRAGVLTLKFKACDWKTAEKFCVNGRRRF